MKRKQRAALQGPPSKKKLAAVAGMAASQAVARSQGMGPPIPRKTLRFQVVSPNMEKKNIDIGGPNTITMTFATATWFGGTLLNGVAQGLTPNTRVGRKTTMVSLLLRWAASLAATSTGGSPVRIKVVYDKQSNGAAPVITDILTIDSFFAPNNLDNSDRFVTLIDKITDPISTGDSFSVAGVEKVNMALETMFTGTAGAIANILSGSIYIFASMDSGILVASPTLAYISRIRFTDV